MTAVLTGELLPAVDQADVGVMLAGFGRARALRDEWLLQYSSRNTRLAYQLDVNHWLRFLEVSGIDPPAGALRVHTFARLRAQEVDSAKATRARRLAAVNTLYDWMIEDGHVSTANPAAIGRRHAPRPDRRSAAAFALSRDEALALLAAADVDQGVQAVRTSAMVALMLYTGMRVSELVGADVGGLGTHEGHRVLRFVAKGDIDHMVVVPDPVWRRLERYLSGRADIVSGRVPVRLGGVGTMRRRPLFVTASGGRLDRGRCRGCCGGWARRLGSFRSWARMFCGTRVRRLLVMLGVALEDIQDQLCHSDHRVTRRYDHGGVRLDRAPAYALVAHFGE
jgi:integrase/recombinase XerD